MTLLRRTRAILVPHEMERASTLSGCAFVEIASPSRSTRSPAHAPPRPPITQLSGSKSSCPSHDIGRTWTRASENDCTMEVLIIKEDPARTLASVPPGLVQKILNFLPLDKVHEAKQVSKLYRCAAHSAMTRGRWKPVRLVAEHFKRRVMPPLALCRAAWDLDPSETMRVFFIAWPRPAAVPFKAVSRFLAFLEPSLDGLERILKVCEPVHRFDYYFPKPSNHIRVVRIVIRWAKLIGTPISREREGRLEILGERRALVLRCLSRALRSWTDAAVAADFFLQWRKFLGQFCVQPPKLVEYFTRNWEDNKASGFAAALAAARANISRRRDMTLGRPQPARPVPDKTPTVRLCHEVTDFVRDMLRQRERVRERRPRPPPVNRRRAVSPPPRGWRPQPVLPRPAPARRLRHPLRPPVRQVRGRPPPRGNS